MKAIITILSILSLQFATFAQTSGKTPQRAGKNEKRSSDLEYVVSSGRPDYAIAKYTPSDRSKDIVITNLPSTTQALTSVPMNLDMTGAFSFKKHANLDIPFNREVFIEDKLTGKTFNLKACEAYTFNADEPMTNRFVMHVLDKSNMESALSSK